MKKLILLAIIALSFTVQAGNLEIGLEYVKNKNYEQAEQYLLKALQEENKKERKAIAYKYLGVMYDAQKKYDKA